MNQSTVDSAVTNRSSTGWHEGSGARWLRWPEHFGYRPSSGHLLSVAIALSLGLLLAAETGAVSSHGTDFFYYFCVLKLALAGHGGQIYDLQALGRLERSLAYPMRVPHGVIPNVYPPFFAVALAPLAVLPYRVAYGLWLAVNCSLLGVTLVWLEQYAQLTLRRRVVLRAAALCSLPVVVALLQGQFSIILLTLLSVAFFAARARYDNLAGVALGLTMLKPQYALPLLLVFLLHRRWRVILAFGATLTLLVCTSLAVLGTSVYPAFVHTVLQASSWGTAVGGFSPQANRSLAGLMELLLPGPGSTVTTLALDFAAFAVLAYTAVRTRAIDIPFALAVVVGLLTGQHVLIHDLSLLLIPTAVALRCRLVGPTRVEGLLVLLYVAVLIGFRLSIAVPVQLAPIGMCALAVWLLLAGRRSWNVRPWTSRSEHELSV